MADTSERIILLSAIILVVIFVRSTQMYHVAPINEKDGEPINEIEDIMTWKDMQIQIATSRDIYTLGDRFTATVYLVNNHSEEVRMKPIYSNTIIGGVNRTDGIGQFTSWTYPSGTIITLPPNSKNKLDEASFTPNQTGAFIITCMGVEKTILILEQDSAWVTATVINVELSPEHKKMEISSDNNNVPRSLYRAIDKALEELSKEGEVTSLGSQRTLHISTIEAETLIHFFEGEIEKDRLNYEFYVSQANITYSILIQFYLSFVTS